VRAALGTHAFPSLAYRFEYGGRALVISGDTRANPALQELARGADVLIQDATVAPSPLFDDERGARLRDRLSEHHTSPEQAGRIARDADVGTLVLTHLLPGVDPAEIKARAREEFEGRVIVGEDLLEFEA
jgi:ribonuclease BN (tRNA processing enzyme)